LTRRRIHDLGFFEVVDPQLLIGTVKPECAVGGFCLYKPSNGSVNLEGGAGMKPYRIIGVYTHYPPWDREPEYFLLQQYKRWWWWPFNAEWRTWRRISSRDEAFDVLIALNGCMPGLDEWLTGAEKNGHVYLLK
jgi:hypothetical protein